MIPAVHGVQSMGSFPRRVRFRDGSGPADFVASGKEKSSD